MVRGGSSSDGSVHLYSHERALMEQAYRLRRADVSSPTAFHSWREALIPSLREALGVSAAFPPPAPRWTVLHEREDDGLVRRLLHVEIAPSLVMPVYVLHRAGLSSPRRAIVALHGHGGGGKDAVAGVMDLPEVEGAVDRYRYDYGKALARRGYVVFCPDLRGFGRRRLFPGDDLLGSDCLALQGGAISQGRSLLGEWIHDLVLLGRVIGEVPPAGPGGIGVCGFSGGSLAALFFGIFEEKVEAVVVSGYFHSFRDAAYRTNLCACNMLPRVWRWVEMGDLGALLAPRLFIVESGTEDPLNGPRGIADVHEQVEYTKAAYRLIGMEEKFHHVIFEGGHRWDGEGVYPLLMEWFPPEVS